MCGEGGGNLGEIVEAGVWLSGGLVPELSLFGVPLKVRSF